MHAHPYDHGRPCPDCLALWAGARTLDDLGALGARWLEGDLRGVPGYLADRPANETTTLVPTLAALNRAGWWTDGSQPGTTEPDRSQRAWVSGLCSERTANLLQGALLTSELLVLAAPIGAPRSIQVPVSRVGRAECTWAGATWSPPGFVDVFAPYVDGETLVDVFNHGWSVDVIDLRWGRDDLLWDAVRGAVADPVDREVLDYGGAEQDEPGLRIRRPARAA